MKLLAPPMEGVLYDWTLQPVPVLQEKATDSREREAQLQGQSNRVQIGVPQVYDLAKIDGPDATDRAVQVMLDDYDFLLIRMACSFLPDRRSHYVWGRYSIELKSDPKGPEAPIAFDQFPRTVERQSTVKRGFEVTPTFKFSFLEVGALEVSTKAATDKETIVYAPQVAGAGLLTASPSWTFQSNDRAGLVGAREMFLVVKQPKGTTCLARFGFAAEAFGRLGPIPLRRHEDHAGGSEFVRLSPAE